MMLSGCIWKTKKAIFLTWGWDIRLNEKGIIFRLIFKLGCPVFVIAKALKTSEAEIYRFLNGEKMPSEVEARLKRLWLNMVDPHS